MINFLTSECLLSIKCVKIIREQLTGFLEDQVERAEKKKNYKTSKSTDDILTRKPSVLYLGFLYLISDNKHLQIPLKVSLYFWLQLVSGKPMFFSQYAVCFSLSFIYFYHSQI